MSALTERQRADLNIAVLEYLLANGEKYAGSAESFRTEAEITEAVNSSSGLLEKKWTSVIKLQKKVIELEAKVEEYAKKGITVPSGFRSAKAAADGEESNDLRILPRAPAKNSCPGHRGPVNVVCCHPVFAIFASGSDDASIMIWETETGRLEKTLKGHMGPVTGLTFSASGLLMASCSQDLTAKIWDANSFNCTKTLKGHDHAVSQVKFMPSGDQLLTCSRDMTIRYWEVATGYCKLTFSGHSDWVKTIAVSLDGAYLASAGMDQCIKIWQISSGRNVQTLTGHEHVIESVDYGKKPYERATAVPHTVFAAAEGAGATAGVAAKVGARDLADECSYLVSCSRDKTIKLWDPLKAQLLHTFDSHENWVRQVIFHPSFMFLLSCSDDKSVRVHDIKGKRCLRTLADAHTHFIQSISMSPTHSAVVTGSVDKMICVWPCI